MKKPEPLRRVWGFISIPLSVLGLLSLSDQLVNFNRDIQNVINSYKDVFYPVYAFLLSWLWFEIPTWIYDYFTIGLLFATSQRFAFGFIAAKSIIGVLFKNIVRLFTSVLFWPYLLILSLHRIGVYEKDGLVKPNPNDPNALVYKYNFRDEDVLIFKYMGATLILATVILIINYTLF